MSRGNARSREALVAQLVARIRRAAQPSQRDLAADFARAWLDAFPVDDLLQQDPQELATAALEHFTFGLRRPRGRTLLRLLDPAAGAAGSPLYTVVQLVCDDMPFLVDTQAMTFDSTGLAVQLIAHPILWVKRDARGLLRGLSAERADPAKAESWQYLRIDRVPDEATRHALQARLQAALDDVGLAVRDWKAMRSQLQAIIAATQAQPPPLARDVVTESCAFLQWMLDDHFTFLGLRSSRVERQGRNAMVSAVPRSGLGILRASRKAPADHLASAAEQVRVEDLRREARATSMLVVTKSSQQSTVHRPAHLDYVGIKRFDRRGRLIGEWRILGLWTSSAYRASPRDVPLLRLKLARVLRNFELAPGSHDAKRLQQLLETFPRDELFQADPADLTRFATRILGLQERRRVLLLLRSDPFHRFHTALVFVPRERYDEKLLSQIKLLAMTACNGFRVTVDVDIYESTLVRLHLLIRVDPAARDTAVDVAALEHAIVAAAVSWRDGLRTALAATPEVGDTRAASLAARYAAVLPAAYQDEVPVAQALTDILALESVDLAAPQRLRLWRAADEPSSGLHLRRVALGVATPISDILPVLENFGLRVIAERAYDVTAAPGRHAVVQDFELAHRDALRIDLALRGDAFLQALQLTLAGETENDAFNRLLLLGLADVRQIVVLRACCRYLLQTGLPFSQTYMERVLASHPRIAQLFLRLFHLRFDPALARKPSLSLANRVVAAIHTQLDRIASLDDDRILRSLLNVLQAMTRTSHFQWQGPAGTVPETLAFKLDPRAIPDLPRPVPRFEIFVHGVRVEGVHLRMGAVARGGLRWSDRREDFRTEVLGLMKAQHVKNSLIVPVGAKGGFVVRQLAATDTREAQQREVVACYSLFIRALLGLTDNIVGTKVTPPALTVRAEGDDPYLVVAADKGTATFSDTANAIALEAGFWLGDAFASGGSAGYDHKEMGITARGAWECVRRHFRELGTDIQAQDFTVVGIGDMAGDVFGNGMLLSPHIRLLGAFNHQHVFLDPAPDAALSFRERQRLAALPRSTWADYDVKKLSAGGGVFERSAKSIPLSPQLQRLLGAQLPGRNAATPLEVIRALLKLKVDLLWNGGIGTYIKSRAESHLAVGDRSNDALRVDGSEVGAKVVGEGGNLGVTQQGRVEYALAGGRINTDSIDNSAGVNTSDVEVNYKILLARVPFAQRNRLLRKVTDDVAAQVLRNNYLQSQTLSIIERDSVGNLGQYQALIRALVRIEGLDPALERLPTDDEFALRQRQGKGLTRPELAVLLSWQKLSMNRALRESDLPDDPYFASELERYFAAPIRRGHAAAIRRHRLRREIIATATSNSLVNRMGPTFISLMMESTGASASQIARAYTIVRETLGLREIWQRIEALDHVVAAEAQYLAFADSIELTRQLCEWLLQHRRQRLDVAVTVRELQAAVTELRRRSPELLRGEERLRFDERHQSLVAAGMQEPIATQVASLDALKPAFDLVELARERRAPIAKVAVLHAEAGAQLGIDWLRHRCLALKAQSPWQAAAYAGLVDASWRIQRRFTELALRGKGSDAQRLARVLDASDAARKAWTTLLAQLRAASTLDFAALSVGIETVRKLAGR